MNNRFQSTLATASLALIAATASYTFAAIPSDIDLKVAYCQSTGSQYIDTGITASLGLKYEACFMWTGTSSDQSLFGARTSSNRYFPVHWTNTELGKLMIGAGGIYTYPVAGSPSETTDFNGNNISWSRNRRYTVVADLASGTQTITLDGTLIHTGSLYDATTPPDLHVYLFGVNSSGSASQLANVRLYSFRIWQNGALVRDYRPARRGSTYGLWETCGETFCASQSGTAFSDAPALDFNVPYCQSTGSQYIDTGVTASLGLKFETSFEWTAGAVDESLFGARTSNNRYFPVHWAGADYEGFWMLGVGGTYTYPVEGSPTETTSFNSGRPKIAWEKDRRYTVVADMAAGTQALTLDGVLVHSGSLYSATTPPALNIYLFGVNNGGTFAQSAKVRIYSFRIWQDNVLVRDYRPARQDTAYGLWDEVEGRFLASASSTAFPAAPRAISGKPDYCAQWIDSNGSTYIDTDVLGNPGVKAEAVVSWTSTSGDRFILSAQKSSSARCTMVYQDSGCLAAGVDSFERCNNTDPTVVPANSSQYATVAAGQTYTITANFQANAQSIVIDGGAYSSQTVFSRSKAMAGTDLPLYLFARNNNGTADLFATARLHSLKIWQGGMLVRDFIPGIRDGEGCLYDAVSDTCFLSADGGITPAAGLVGPPAGTPTHPKWNIAYLGSHALAHLDTGVVGKPGTKAEAVLDWVDAGRDGCVLGSRKGTSGDNRFYMIYGNVGFLAAGPGVWRYLNASDPASPYSDPWGDTKTPVRIAAGQTYTVAAEYGADAQTITFNGSTVLDSSFTVTDTERTLYLFALNNDGAPAVRSNVRIRSLKIWQNGECVRDLVPVLADNGGPYLYDRKHNVFYQSATDVGLWDVGAITGRYKTGTVITFR